MDTPETSTSGSPSMDLNAKYQKLATEYSKMRAQVIVLKKGVLDEQAKSNELRDELKEKDQRLRKSEQEIECLTFRNQQLTKRVSVLQDELDQQQATSKRSKSKPGDRHTQAQSAMDSESLTVLNTELQSKIVENEALHGKLQGLELDYGSTIEDLSRQLEELKCSSSAKQKEQAELIEQQRQSFNQVHQEKVRLETKLTAVQTELDRAKMFTQKFLGHRISDTETPETDMVSSGDDGDQILSQLKNRITELIDELNEAESKASLFHAECNRLKSRLQISADDKREAERKLEDLEKLCGVLREDASTTIRNYESQLSTMSDHLASMTEKWSAQQEEIDTLKLMKNGNFSNGRNKSKHK